MRSTTLLLCLCGLVFMFHGNLAVAQKPAYNEICHTLKHNVQDCWPTNVGEQCNYCHEDAVFTESMMSWDNCDGEASGRCANQGFPVCCYDPWYSNPTKLRLAFWWKAGTSCASMGKESCTHAKGKGNPLSAIIIEERASNKRMKQQQREKRQQQKERRDSVDFYNTGYRQNQIGRTWHRRYLIADEDDEEIGSNSNSCYSSCTAAINKRLSPLMYNVLVNQCQKTCRKLSSERGDIYIN